MNGYILSILGIVVAGIIIDIIIPSGSINKYIRSIYSIFILAVLITPIIKFVGNLKGFSLEYENYQVNEQLLNFIYNKHSIATEKDIENALFESGFENVDIILKYSIKNEVLTYNSCNVNLSNLVINEKAEHINKYEFIVETVFEYTNLDKKVVMFNE